MERLRPGRIAHERLTRLRRGGFSVVEMLVVLAIIGVLSVIVIVGHSSFSQTLLLANTTSDVALSLRNAQVYGIGSRAIGAVSNAGYGIDFSSANPSSFTFFADIDPNPCTTSYNPTCKIGNNLYSNATELVQTFLLNNGMKIDNFCAIAGSNTYCKTGGTVNEMKQLSIVFTRPNTSAAFTIVNSSNAVVTGVSFTKVCVTIASPEGASRSLFVTQVGGIAKGGSCPPSGGAL